MNLLMTSLISVFVVWVLACAWAGYRARFKRFGVILLLGLAINQLWMGLGLGAQPLEFNAIVAQISLLLYGFCAFGLAWFVGRMARRLRQSEVDSAGL